MKTVWTIVLDRYGDKSKAKSLNGKLFSVIETAELLIKEYNGQGTKPELRVVAFGPGAGLADYLTSKEIPVIEVLPYRSRIGGADVYKYRED